MPENKSQKKLPALVGFKTKPDDPLVAELRKAAEDAGVSYSEFIRAAIAEGAPRARARIIEAREAETARIKGAFAQAKPGSQK